MSTFVIVGASLAGGTAAATLREEGFDGRIVLIGEERHPPYERPPLSKQYLRGEQPFEKALVRMPEFYAAERIEVLFGVRATRVDDRERVVELAGGERVSYDRLLIATGSRNRRPPIPGIRLKGVYDLRTLEDADRIRGEIAPGRRAVVVGMGFIGSEVAASLRLRRVEVATVELERVPLARALGADVGRALEQTHREHGVKMAFDDGVMAFEGRERVERVLTRSGRAFECDFAVVGLGVEPVTDLCAGTGVAVEDGILVDEYCRTSVEGIYAAGDVANHYHPIFGRRMRVEHWHNAMKQGAAAARSMLGKGEPYTEVHWFWSDQYDLNLQYAGFHRDWDELVVRGSPETRSFIAFYLKAGRLHAVAGINRGKDVRRAMSLIQAQVPVDASALRDEATDLRKLA